MDRQHYFNTSIQHRQYQDGWYFNGSTQEFWQYQDGEVVAKVSREAWTDYWISLLHDRGRVL